MKKFISLLLALTILFGLTACGSAKEAAAPTPEQPQTQTAAPAPQEAGQEAPAEVPAEVPASRMFTDDCGRTVELPGEITAIVPSGPLAQIVLYAIAPDMLVGLAAKWTDAARGYVPEKYLSLPFFGQLYGSADLNVEELALAAPQLIVDIGEAKKSVIEDMDSLQKLTTIPSVHIEATLGTMGDTFRTLGTLLGREAQGEALAQFCERVYSRTTAIMGEVGENRVKALYILGEDGLSVLANGSYHAELIDLLTDNLAVVENPAAKGTGNQVTLEQIAMWDPDFILFAPGSIYSEVSGLDAWKDISAIADGCYIEVPEGPHNWMGNPPAVQRYLGLIWLTAELYPDFCDYDAAAEIREYYELFYHCTLTDEQLASLTANAVLN